jgi:hypothetical protein
MDIGCKIDILVDVALGKVNIRNQSLISILALTPADKRFMDGLLAVVSGENTNTRGGWEGKKIIFFFIVFYVFFYVFLCFFMLFLCFFYVFFFI